MYLRSEPDDEPFELIVEDEIVRKARELLVMADDHVGGHPGIGPNDAYTVAMVEVLDDAVLTDDVDDFEGLGVPVETY